MRVFPDRGFEALEGLSQAFLIALFPEVTALQIGLSGAPLLGPPAEGKGNRRRDDLEPNAENDLVCQIARDCLGLAPLTAVDLRPDCGACLKCQKMSAHTQATGTTLNP